MYFDETEEPLDKPVELEIGVVVAIAGLFIAFFFIYPSPLVSGAMAAAASLFAG